MLYDSAVHSLGYLVCKRKRKYTLFYYTKYHTLLVFASQLVSTSAARMGSNATCVIPAIVFCKVNFQFLQLSYFHFISKLLFMLFAFHLNLNLNLYLYLYLYLYLFIMT